MTDLPLLVPDITSELTPLPPFEVKPLELLDWEVLLPTNADGTPISPNEPFTVTYRAPSEPPRFAALGDAPLRSLFRGERVVAAFGSVPPPEYDLVFGFFERSLAVFSAAARRRLRDAECEKLFSELRRRPDGRHDTPLSRYAHATLRLLLLLRPTSASEYDALLRRLERSARTFGQGPTSTNYFDKVLVDFLDA